MTSASLLLCITMVVGAKPVVMISPEDRLPILGPVLQAVQAQLVDLPVELRIQRVLRLENGLAAQMRSVRKFATEDALAVVWLELSPGDPIFIYVADPQKRRVLVRSVDWDGALGHLEAVALVIRSSVQALLSGQTIGFEADAPLAEGLSPAVISAKQPNPFQLSLRLGYAPSAIADQAPIFHGLEIAAVVGWRNRFYVGMEYRQVDSFLKRKGQYVVVLVRRYPISLLAGARVQKGRWELAGEMAVTLHVVSMDMREVGPWPSLPAPRDQYLYSAGPTVMGRMTLLAPLSAFAGVGTDIALGERRYLLDGRAGGAVLEPWRFQWKALMGLQWEIF